MFKSLISFDCSEKAFQSRFNFNMCFAIFVGFSYGFALYILSVFNDYLTKYWLYNKNTRKYDVFNK